MLPACDRGASNASRARLQAKSVEFGGDFTPYVSTRWYRAPELLLKAKKYTPAVDMWALGALMAELYSLRPLFSGSSEADMLFKIGSTLGTPTGWAQGQALARQAGYHFPRVEALGLASLIPSASPDALEFIQALLQFDPANRPTAEAALKLPFMQGPTQYVAPIVATPRPSDEAAAKAEAAKFVRSMSQRNVSGGEDQRRRSDGKRRESKDGSGHGSEDDGYSGKSDESGGASPSHRRAISMFADTEQGRAAAANHAASLAARSSLQRNDTSKTSYSDGASGAGSGVGAGAGGGRGDRGRGHSGSGSMGRKTQSFQQQPRRSGGAAGRGRGEDVGEDYSAAVLHGPAVGSLGLRGKTSSNHSNGTGRARASPGGGAAAGAAAPAGLRLRANASESVGSSIESPLSSVAGSPRTDIMDVGTPMTNLFGRHGAASARTNGSGGGTNTGGASSLAASGAGAVAPSAKFGRRNTGDRRAPVAGRRATTGGRPAAHGTSLTRGDAPGRRRRTDAGGNSHSGFPSASGQRSANKMNSTAGSAGSSAGILSRIKALGNSFEDVSYDFDDATLGSGLR